MDEKYDSSVSQTRLLSEKVSDQPETHDDKDKVVEFSIPSWQVRGDIFRGIEVTLHYHYHDVDTQRVGEDGLQSGHLQLHDHRVREARHQRLHLDHAQDQGGVGLKLKVDHHDASLCCVINVCLPLTLASYHRRLLLNNQQ